MPFKQIYFSSDDKPIVDRFSKLAKQKGSSFSKLLIEAIKEYLKKATK